MKIAPPKPSSASDPVEIDALAVRGEFIRAVRVLLQQSKMAHGGGGQGTLDDTQDAQVLCTYNSIVLRWMPRHRFSDDKFGLNVAKFGQSSVPSSTFPDTD